MTGVRACAAIALVVAAAAARAEDAGPAMAPAAVAVDAAAAPIAVRQEDAAAVLRPPLEPAPAPPPPAVPVTRTVPVDDAGSGAPVVNPTPHFVFHDATERSVPPGKSLAEREAAVEVLRQAVRRAGAGQ